MRLWLDRLLQDLRYAARGLARNPGFALVIIVSLSLGIGANSALFSVLDAVLLRPMPVSHPEQLFALDLTASRFRAPQRFSYPNFERMRAVAPSGIAAMSRIARMRGRIDATNGGTTDPETIRVQLVSGEYFRVLGIAPALGRVLAPGDNERIGEHPVAVISHDFFERRFGSARHVLGRGLTLNGAHFTIVGVAAPGYHGLWLESPTDIWIPLMMQSATHYAQNFSSTDSDNPDKPWPPQENIRWLDVVVRTRHDAAAIDTLFRQWLAVRAEKIGNPETRRLFLAQRVILNPVERGFSNLRGRFRSPLFALAGMVALVLLIACFNTANLMLARASSRTREIAVRLSVGAGRGRLIRQLLTESFLLAGIAALAGLAIAHLASQLLVRATLGISEGPPPFTTGVNVRVLAFTLGLSVLTAVLFGLLPAIRATRVDLEAALRAGSRSIYGARLNSQKLLVSAQIALTFVLVVAAAWFTASLRYLARLNLGYDQDHVITVGIDPQSAGYPETQLPALHRRLVESVEALPSVESAVVAMCGLAAGCVSNSSVDIPGYQPAPGEEARLQWNIVGLNYFSTVGMRLLSGRDFTERDNGQTPVAILNEAAVRRYFSARDPIGRRFGWGKAQAEIVGVVADARVNNAREAAPPMFFSPLAESTIYGGSLEVRVIGDPAARMREIREAVMNVDRNLPIDSIRTIRQQVSGDLRQDRVITWLAAIFGALALALACFGIYGAMSYVVTRRTGEMGIRKALGASPPRVFAMVLSESLMLLALGLLAGAPLLFASARLAATVVLGVDLRDPLIVCAAALAVAIAAAFAAYLPARRAALLDPVAALRAE
jgi:macrolide transport system ATP-binding/permease protein